jgi:hypothetical protein
MPIKEVDILQGAVSERGVRIPKMSAKHLTQQEIERHYFEQFQNVFDLPEGQIEYGDKPDVTIPGARRIGIEITNFYLERGSLSSSEQRQAERRESVVSKAQDLYLKRGGKNVEFSFGFDKTHPIEDIDALAGEIAGLASKLDCRHNGPIPRDQYRHIKELDFMYLFSGHLKHSDRRDARALAQEIYGQLKFEARWKVVQVHSHDLMATERLQEIVRAKETKIQQYSQCDAYWLLVVVDFIDAAQEQEIRVDDVSLISDLFEQVIVYKPAFEHVVCIIPQRSTISHE